MNANAVVCEGVITSDGMLQMSGKIPLPAGKVEVTVRTLTEPSLQEDWLQFLQRARRELEVRGGPFMNERELDAHVEWLREGDEVDAILLQADQVRRPC